MCIYHIYIYIVFLYDIFLFIYCTYIESLQSDYIKYTFRILSGFPGWPLARLRSRSSMPHAWPQTQGGIAKGSEGLKVSGSPQGPKKLGSL